MDRANIRISYTDVVERTGDMLNKIAKVLGEHGGFPISDKIFLPKKLPYGAGGQVCGVIVVDDSGVAIGNIQVHGGAVGLSYAMDHLGNELIDLLPVFRAEDPVLPHNFGLAADDAEPVAAVELSQRGWSGAP